LETKTWNIFKTNTKTELGYVANINITHTLKMIYNALGKEAKTSRDHSLRPEVAL